MTTCELRLKAADALEQHGHAKGVFRDSGGRMCLMGALFFAAIGKATPFSGVNLWTLDRRIDQTLIATALIEMGFAGDKPSEVSFAEAWDDAATWNNRVWTTAQAVIDRLRLGCETPKEVINALP
jgi:hypothetical protein